MLIMPKEVSDLVLEIVSTGKRKGMTQKDIARVARMDEVSLSRAKRADDIRLSSLIAMAKSVGLKVTLVSDSSLAEKVRRGELFE